MIPISDENQPGPLPIVNLAIIVINILVFAVIQLQNDAFTMGFSVIPAEITHGVDLVGPVRIALGDGTSGVITEASGPNPIWLTLFTSTFMHGGWAHLLGNMLFLFIFGDNIERLYGSLRYLVFYLFCGVVASYAQVLSNPESVIPSLGASGAISGGLAAYLVNFPNNRVRVLIGLGAVTQVPAMLMIGLWALLQFASGFGSIAVSEQTGGVAYWAHIGGFLAGAAIALLVRRLFPSSGLAPRPGT